ncbi:hypothetical protein G4B11_000261 [Aspergillus flavus]|nr:hypothetical protein G4B11_000261 [Aspergillus flavus]
MGVDTRRPILPAPTESIVDTTTTGGSVTGTDLATDVSRRTDKTSYSIPDDGSPVTISTRRKNRTHGDESKLSRSAQHSQTSLLIEYFEGGKGSGSLVSRPSVRVRVTPSNSRKRKDSKDHIQITESNGNRKPVYSRRISFSSPSKNNKSSDDYSICSFNSGTDENQQPSGHTPVEIELVNRDQSSELSSDTRYFQPTSDISSMPADSMLEASSSNIRRKRSQSSSREREHSPEYKDYLQTPRRQRSRSLSTERIAHRVAEKLSNDPRETCKGQRKKGDTADFHEPESKSRSRLSVYPDEDMSPNPSLLSASALSAHRKSGDQYSFRSGTSKSSINNPKLLETVEDAIRRLILPELKELKKDQKVMTNTSKFERDMNTSHSSGSTPSRDELGRRLSKHASAPDVTRPTVVLNKDDQDEGIVLSGEPAPSQQDRRPSDAPTEASYVKWGLRPELTEQEKLRRQKSKGLRDAEKAARVGSALTAAALKHHDSRSSIDKTERRRPSGPRSGNGSFNDTELVFQKHNVAPMPLRSAIESDMTRDSLLSEQTAEPYGSRETSEIHDTRSPHRDLLDSRYDLKHSNFSSHDLSLHDYPEEDYREQSLSPVGDAAAGAIAAAAAANLLDEHPGRHGSKFTDRRRTLSPIQSVASNQSESHIKQDSIQPVEHDFSGTEREMEQRLSIDSLSSAPSTNLARSSRPHGISPAGQKEFLRHNNKYGAELGYEESPAMSPRSMTETASTDPKRMTGFTDESEVSYMEKVNQRQPVAGIGANPQVIHPIAVESAVASLLDPSIVDTKSNQSAPNRSQTDLSRRLEGQSPKPVERANQTPHGSRQGSPLKQRQDASSPDATSFPRRMGATSPPQSVTQSLEDQTDPTHMFSEGIHDRESPSPEADRSPDSESEINTNPSIIQGPIGGGMHGGNWAYEQTPDNRGQSPIFDNAGSAGNTGPGSGDQPDYGHDYYETNDYNPDNYLNHQYSRGPLFGTPPGKDEGYVSAPNPLSPGVDTPEPLDKGFGGMDTNGMGLFDSPTGADDQFMSGHQRQLSGYSQGVGSPLYDSATGRGIDRIQSQDIVALMDHLTVRDAQRNARDTEILVTLVRSAAEMRNSFEEMKKFIAQQDGMLMEASDKQHDRTYRALGGPRPLPASTRSARQSSAEDEDLRSKRKNVFKRALKGLSLKSSNDLSRIEDMLEQLLDEVEALRDGQDERLGRSGPRSASVDPEGYEPEGHAGTSSPDHSGYLLSTSSRPMPESRGNGLRRDSEHRVSTVPEADEEMELNERGKFLSPNPTNDQQDRAGPSSASTPPRAPMASGALSNETSPKTNEKSKKHKSSSSSFFPKISRWSKTTASSMGDNIRNSIQPGRKERPSFDASRSGSDIQGPYKAADWYDPQGDDRLRSTYTLDDQQQENRPPSPLVPSQVSEAPKYRAHRGSLDLQHPQPRQGPTGRYQSQLETQAQIYGMPSGAPSDQWNSNPSLSAGNPNPRHSSGASRLSPISDVGYSEASSRHTGPPRPPKIKDDGPLVPERPPKVKEDDERSYVDRVASRNSALLSSPRSTPPPRKPTGPRPLNSGSQYSSPSRRKRSQYRASPDQVDEESLY